MFERNFQQRSIEAKDVVSELRNFPEVSKEDPRRLWKFFVVCTQAVILAETEQGKALAILDFADAQTDVTSRLGQ